MIQGGTDRGATLLRPRFDGILSGKRILRRISASVALLGVFLCSWTGWSPLTPCRFKSLTGFSCPTCGMTRSFHALVHGEILDAFRFNPMGPVFFVILLLVFARLSLEAATGRSVIIPVPKPLLLTSIALLLGLWLGFGMTRIFLEITAIG